MTIDEIEEVLMKFEIRKKESSITTESQKIVKQMIKNLKNI